LKNHSTKEIFNVLDSIKHSIYLGVRNFTNNRVIREKAIKNMEIHFNNIIKTINQYYNKKKDKKENIIHVKIYLRKDTHLDFWKNSLMLEKLTSSLSHGFCIPAKNIEVSIEFLI